MMMMNRTGSLRQLPVHNEDVDEKDTNTLVPNIKGNASGKDVLASSRIEVPLSSDAGAIGTTKSYSRVSQFFTDFFGISKPNPSTTTAATVVGNNVNSGASSVKSSNSFVNSSTVDSPSSLENNSPQVQPTQDRKRAGTIVGISSDSLRAVKSSPSIRKKPSVFGSIIDVNNHLAANKTIEIERYSLCFSSIFSHKDILDEFYAFLDKESSTENMDFLNDYKTLLKTKTPSKIVQLATTLMEEYIQNDAPKELNISGAIRRTIVEKFDTRRQAFVKDQWVLDETPEEFFKVVKDIVILQLSTDSWQRFLKTKSCEELKIKYKANPKVTYLSTFAPNILVRKDFETQDVGDEHFGFMKKLLNVYPNWKLVGYSHFKTSKAVKNVAQNCDIFTYMSTENILPLLNLRSPFLVKYEMILPYPMHHFVKACTTKDALKRTIPFLSGELPDVSSNDLKEEVCQVIIDELELAAKAPGLHPVTVLAMEFAAALQHQKQNISLAMEMHKDSFSVLKKPVVKSVRQQQAELFDFSWTVFQKMTKDITKVVEVHLSDFANMLSSSSSKTQYCEKFASMLQESYKSQLEEIMENAEKEKVKVIHQDVQSLTALDSVEKLYLVVKKKYDEELEFIETTANNAAFLKKTEFVLYSNNSIIINNGNNNNNNNSASTNSEEDGTSSNNDAKQMDDDIMNPSMSSGDEDEITENDPKSLCTSSTTTTTTTTSNIHSSSINTPTVATDILSLNNSSDVIVQNQASSTSNPNDISLSPSSYSRTSPSVKPININVNKPKKKNDSSLSWMSFLDQETTQVKK